MSDITESLLDLKKEIEDAEKEAAVLEGKLESHMERLKSTWGCSSVEEAQTKITSMDKEVDELQVELEETITAIEKLGWTVGDTE